MIVCLVTDRRRLAGAATGLDGSIRCIESQARHAVDAGVDLLQVRERDLDASPLVAIVRAVVDIARGTRTRVVVNDRLDVALACGADGVHLRSDSIAPGAARQLAPAGFLIGQSVHSADEARRAVGADYLIAGTVFRSESKDRSHALIGLSGLRVIVETVAVPVLAIGGIAAGSVDDVAGVGAAGCAAIGLFMAAPGTGTVDPPVCRAVPLRAIVSGMRQRFDSMKTPP